MPSLHWEENYYSLEFPIFDSVVCIWVYPTLDVNANFCVEILGKLLFCLLFMLTWMFSQVIIGDCNF